MSFKPINQVVSVQDVCVGSWIIYDDQLELVERINWNRSCQWYEIKLSSRSEEVNIYHDGFVTRVYLAVDPSML